MKGNKYIWALIESEETDSIYSELDDNTIRAIAEKIFPFAEDLDDPNTPKDIEHMAKIIKRECIDNRNYCFEYLTFRLKRYLLNEGGDDDVEQVFGLCIKTEAGRGDTVYEFAAKYSLGGCDQSYILVPIIFFAEHPVQVDEVLIGDKLVESAWREHIVK